MLTTLTLMIVTFFLHALVLKLAVGTMGVPEDKNRYAKALQIAFALSIVGFLLGFIPMVGWFVYALVWVGVIMSAYDLGFMKSIGVAIVQVGLKIVVWLITLILPIDIPFSQVL